MRYELVRALALQEKFAEARESIQQLVNMDVSKLMPEEQGARFYVDLARLWEGNLDLLDAVWPPRCLVCGDETWDGALPGLCARGGDRLPRSHRPRRRCGAAPVKAQPVNRYCSNPRQNAPRDWQNSTNCAIRVEHGRQSCKHTSWTA